MCQCVDQTNYRSTYSNFQNKEKEYDLIGDENNI